MASKIYVVLSWLLVALAGLHIASTFRIYDAPTMQALWFLAGGLLILLGAVLNLVNRSYGTDAPGLRAFTIATNVVVGLVAGAGGVLSKASPAQMVVVLGVYLAITALSCTRSVLRPGASTAAR